MPDRKSLFYRILELRESNPDIWIKVHAQYDDNPGCEGCRLVMCGNPTDFLHALMKSQLMIMTIIEEETASSMMATDGCDILITTKFDTDESI